MTEKNPVASREARTSPLPRLHFLTNGIFSTSVAGGDLHCFDLARAAIDAGHPVTFWGGHILKRVLAEHGVQADLVLTESAAPDKSHNRALAGQFGLFAEFFRRFIGTLRQLRRIQKEDVVYAVSDYWFDVLPAVWCPARRKLMVWHMQAPSLMQVVRRSRPDVDSARVASLHYWASQNLSLRAFRCCRNKRLFHVHPAMRDRLLRMGYDEGEIKYMSFGMDAQPPPGSDAPTKTYDACWIGRVHRQKGVEDLLATLAFLAGKVEGFRAVLIGNLKKDLEPRVRAMGLEGSVIFPGFVSETEKFRLFRASRVFLMPSRFEGSPRSIGEALLCALPVVAYEIENYRPIFGELLRYVPCFDLEAFQRAALEQIELSRRGAAAPPPEGLGRFVQENSWQTLRERFLATLRDWR